jgi:hypothetical protein
MKRSIMLGFCVMAVSMLSSCYTVHSFINKDVKTDGKIAVIIGNTKYAEVDGPYADIVSATFASQSKLKVVPQSAVKASIAKYPVRIQGPYTVYGMDEPKVDYNKTDKAALAEMAKKLDVQYVYAFWIDRGVKRGGSTDMTFYYYIAQLIEFPSGKVIAQGDMSMMYVSKGTVVGSVPRSIDEMCKQYGEGAAKEIIQNTGIGK